jgi:chromosome segregation ATPase
MRNENFNLKSSNRFLSIKSSIRTIKSGSKETSVNSDINQTNIQNHKLILEELREELTQQIKKYNQILIDYENTTTRENYNKLFDKYKKLEQEYIKISLKKKELEYSLDKLLEIKNHVKTQYDKLSEQKFTLNNSSTPRPNWNRCADVIDGGMLY